jgi:chromosome partitioning protein
MAKVIAIANQKGGVGKTTTCVNLSASLAALRRAVLLIDLDPQGNATMGSGIDKNTQSITVNEILLNESEVQQAIVTTTVGYNILPSNQDLTQAEIGLLECDSREHRLANAIAQVRNAYDYILIDCPPALNMLTVNALVAADSILIPMQCEYYALEGLTALIDTIEKIKKAANSKLQIEGILRTMYDARNALSSQVSDQLIKHFSRRVYSTIIPRNIRLAEAPSHGLPAMLYDKGSSGSVAYQALAEELMRRHEIAVLVKAELNSKAETST